ncbi:unnamed protein product [Caenorhabditis brenneri]
MLDPSIWKKKPMKQPNNDLSEVMGQLSVATDDSDKTSPSLSDMPVDIVGPIIEKLDYRQQLRLRKMSKSFRALVDKLKPACKSIEVVFEYGSVTIKFDDFLVTYKKHKYDDDDGIIVIRDDFEKAALDDLASNLKNSKLQLKELSFHFSVHFYDTGKNYAEKYCKKIRKGLECLNHQVSVKEINLKGSSPSCLLTILPYLKPGVLENITFGGDDLNSQSTEMDQVARLDQWKKAQELKLMYCFDRFPMKYATHFKRLYIVAAKIDGDKVIRIKDYLSKLHSFEQCTLSCWKFFVEPDLVFELLEAPVSSNATEVIFHHLIPDSNYYFEFTWSWGTDEIIIERKKRRMSEDPGSGVKKPMEPSSLLEVILIFIGSLLLKAIEYLSAFTHTSHKSLTPPKNLSDLPADVVSLIVERLDYKEQLLLRKVSKCLRSLVDKLKPACKSIIFVCTEEQVVMGMNDHFVMYRNDADGDDSYLYDDFHGIIVIREDFKKAVFDDLASNLKHPKLKLDEFRVEFDACDEEDIMTYYNNLQCILESLSHQLSVKKVDPFDKFPMKCATHFKRFYISEEEIEIDTFIRIRDYLSKLQNLEQCTLSSFRFRSNFDLVHQVLGAPVSSNATEMIFHYPIPDSNYYLEFTKPIKARMSEDSCSGVKKPMEPSSLLEAILIFIGSLLLEAIGYLSALTHSSHKSSTPPKNLSELPADVVSLIVEKLDYKEQLILRKVSKFLRSLIDKQNPACKSIRVTCLEKGIEINMNHLSVAYTSNADYDTLMRYEDDYEIIVIRDDYRQIAFDDLASTLKNPMLQLDYFNVDFDFYDEKDRKIKAVALLNQWKQAIELKLWVPFDKFPMKCATHFKRFYISEEEIETDTFIRIRDYLSKLHSFEQCILSSFRFRSIFYLVHQVLGAPVSSNATEMIFHYPIPDSNYYLEFTKPIKEYSFEIKKKKREDN